MAFENNLWNVFILGLIPGLLTSFGGLIGLVGLRISHKYLELGLSFSAGIMLVASFTSLILPAIEVSGFFIVFIGFFIGVLIMMLINHYVPHQHFERGYEGPEWFRNRVPMIWLIILSILIHNLPEGLAVGVVSSTGFREGLIIAIAIGVQDIPEGFAVAFLLTMMDRRIGKALYVSFLSGFSETLMAVLAAFVSMYSRYLLPLLLALAGGSMIYVVTHEIIPETFRSGYETYASIGFLIGFIIMLWLDTLF